MAVLRCSNIIITSQFKLYVYMYMHLSMCLLLVFYCLRPSWKIDVLSNEWPLEIDFIIIIMIIMIIIIIIIIIIISVE